MKKLSLIFDLAYRQIELVELISLCFRLCADTKSLCATEFRWQTGSWTKTGNRKVFCSVGNDGNQNSTDCLFVLLIQIGSDALVGKYKCCNDTPKPLKQCCYTNVSNPAIATELNFWPNKDPGLCDSVCVISEEEVLFNVTIFSLSRSSLWQILRISLPSLI